MKIKNGTYQYVKDAIEKVVHHIGLDSCKACYQQDKIQTAWNLWFMATGDILNGDSHPRFRTRERILPFDPDFDIYQDGVNDAHIETALKKICNGLLGA